MPVKIRLTRMGKKKQPTYRVVVVDSRKPRDGAHIEQIGRYDPRQEPSIVEIDNDRALKWLQDGAQPTERAQKLLEISGAWARFRVARGEIHTIDEAPIPQPPAAAEPAVSAADAGPESETEAISESQDDGTEATVEPAAEDTVEPAAEVAEDVSATDEGPAAAEGDSGEKEQ